MIRTLFRSEQLQISERSEHHLKISANEHTAAVAKIIAADWNQDGQNVTSPPFRIPKHGISSLIRTLFGDTRHTQIPSTLKHPGGNVFG